MQQNSNPANIVHGVSCTYEMIVPGCSNLLPAPCFNSVIYIHIHLHVHTHPHTALTPNCPSFASAPKTAWTALGDGVVNFVLGPWLFISFYELSWKMHGLNECHMLDACDSCEHARSAGAVTNGWRPDVLFCCRLQVAGCRAERARDFFDRK